MAPRLRPPAMAMVAGAAGTIVAAAALLLAYRRWRVQTGAAAGRSEGAAAAASTVSVLPLNDAMRTSIPLVKLPNNCTGVDVDAVRRRQASKNPVFTDDQIIARIAECNNTADAWYTIGRDMRRGCRVQVNGVEYDEQSVFLRALSIDPTYAPAWNGLGSTIGEHRTVVVPGFNNDEPLDQVALYVQAVTCGPGHAKAWRNLSVSDGIASRLPLTIGGVVYRNTCDILLNALEAKPDYGDAWRSLAYAMERNQFTTVQLRSGETVTAVQALIKAIEAGDGSSWLALAINLISQNSDGVVVRGETVTGPQAMILGAVEDSTEPAHWDNLAVLCVRTDAQGIEISGRTWSPVDLLRQACELDHERWPALVRLADAMATERRDVVHLWGKDLHRMALAIMSLGCNDPDVRAPVTSMAYVRIAKDMIADRLPSIEVGDRTLTLPDVCREAEQAALAVVHPTETHEFEPLAPVWEVVASALFEGALYEYTTVDGVHLDVQTAASRSLDMNPAQAESWFVAARALMTDPDAPVTEKVFATKARIADGSASTDEIVHNYSVLECLSIAASITPFCRTSAEVWRTLAEAMRRAGVEAQMINQTMMTLTMCVANAVDIDPTHSGTWLLLGQSLRDDMTVRLSFQHLEIKRGDCFTRAADAADADAGAWCALGGEMLKRRIPQVTLPSNGKSLKVVECLVRAVQLCGEDGEPTAATRRVLGTTWRLMGDCLAAADTGIVRLRDSEPPLTRPDCYAQSISYAPCRDAYMSLGAILGPDDTVVLKDGTAFSKDDCYLAAEECVAHPPPQQPSP